MIRTIPTLCWSVAANPSPLGVKMHDAGYRAAELDFKYIALGSDDIATVVDAVRTLGVRGLGVSMPHKVAVIDLLDEVTDDVKALGACNTVVNDQARLTGHNTDWQGAWRAIEEAGLSSCDSALIVGGGGVARAIAYALKMHEMRVTIATRSEEQGAVVSRELGLDGSVGIERQSTADAQLIINATPDSSAVDLAAHRRAVGVLDVIFQTRTTPLTREAQERGLRSAEGWRMLLHQGAAQFELYTQTSAPLEAMGAVLEAALPKT